MTDKSGKGLCSSENQTHMTVWMLEMHMTSFYFIFMVSAFFLVKNPVVSMMVLQQETTDR